MRVLALAAALLVGVMTGESRAADPSVWNDIMNTKQFVACVVPEYQPYSWKDRASGEWKGFAADMARDVAKDLHVQPAFVETSFKTVILDLQSAKCHAFFGFNATPERALAIDFA